MADVGADFRSTALVVETAMGWAGVALGERGIVAATLFHRTRAPAMSELRSRGAIEGEDERSGEIERMLRGYAVGDGAHLDGYPVDLPECTTFQRDVWLALRDIPRGETRSYGWLARRVGHGESPRAVGATVGANPIPLWLPCHRVVASDGSLHGFGGGLAMKQALLELEGALPRRMIGSR
jgi:O-6-methylguanine DNA methyltransferase